VREEVKRREQTEKRKKVMRLVPIGAVMMVFIGLASALIWFSLQMQESQTASQRTATAVVFFAQTATESVNRLMATPSFNTAVAQIQEATRTQAAIETVMQSYRLTYAKGTQSVEETIIALTPTKTPTLTRTPTNTPIPRPTSTPIPVRTNVGLEYPTGCNPNPVPAGIIVFGYGVGSGSTDPETAKRIIGATTFGTITLNGNVVPPASFAPFGGFGIDEHGRTTEPNCSTQGCSYDTFAEIKLSPGKYEVRGTWPRADGSQDPRSCTLTVN